jgi:NAD(P)-dependent dehydrogenase (short-subunit alcohol dehydrogenase family)
MRLTGRTAIVTGAASGIGRAIAKRFAYEGAKVLIADLRESPVEGGTPVHEDINAAGGEAIFLETDVASASHLARAVATVLDRWGHLDIMVNNAATYVGKALLETSEEEWDRVMAVNATGVFLGCKYAVAQMLKQELRGEVRGRLINISSQQGMIACPGDIAYGTGKAAAIYLTRQIASDYAVQGIVCNAVAPGKVVAGNAPEDHDAAALAIYRSRTPWPRLGRPEDIASAALFLASDEASFITGHNLLVDGGWMAA